MTQMLLVVVLVLALVVAALWVLLIRIRADVQQLVEIHEVDEVDDDVPSATAEAPAPSTVPKPRSADPVGARPADTGTDRAPGRLRLRRIPTQSPVSPESEVPAAAENGTAGAAVEVSVAERVPVITELNGAAASSSPNLTTARVASVTLGRPLIKAASLAYGVRRALDEEHRIRMQVAFRSELRRQRKLRRRVHANSAGASDS